MATIPDWTAEFKRRGPWVTRFVIDGKAYGGEYDALNDSRLTWFFESFPSAANILELGSLEGGHTFGLARHPGVQHVVGVEARRANVEKARFVQRLVDVRNVEFVIANLEVEDLQRFGCFDAVYCVGVLYHLPEPWRLIEQISQVSTNLFLWTHYADTARTNIRANQYRGMKYREHGLSDPLSGMSPWSFWLSLESLLDMLNQHGFRTIHTIEDAPAHPNGPCVTLAAMAT